MTSEAPGKRPGTAALASEDSLDIAELSARYERRTLTPSALVDGLLARISARGDDHVWIDLLSRDELTAIARRLETQGAAGKPLYGIPFAIKDNIDLAHHATTAACPAFAYRAHESAPAVQRLIDAGAIPIGKTNLDQFATGLTGTRSPYGAPSSALRAGYISGGSSSGSAVAVAAGLVSFALGTDTAGSGRVPAAFNNVIGLKPTRGLISTRGVVPACRSLDCVSLFALTAGDALAALRAAAGFDAADAFSRQERAPAANVPQEVAGCRFGVPRIDQLRFFGNEDGEQRFAKMLQTIEGLGGRLIEIDFAPFVETAQLLYEGPWLAERYIVLREIFAGKPDAIHPITRQVIEGGSRPSAADAFSAYYRLKELDRATQAAWQAMDLLITPTAGRQYTIDEILADPVRLNTALGYYTNYVNLLDLCAVAVPAGFQADGLPFSVTLLAPAWNDAALSTLADSLHRAQDVPLGALNRRLGDTPRLVLPARFDRPVRVAVCGAHMSGLPLNHQLTERGARLVRSARTAPRYRLYALPGGPPQRPGLVRGESGQSIEVEVWEVPDAAFGSFVAAVAAPLAIGSVELEDGEVVKGFVCEGYATADAADITEFGGWRHYLARQHAA